MKVLMPISWVLIILCGACLLITLIVVILPQTFPQEEDQPTFDSTYRWYHQYDEGKYCYVLQAVDPKTNETFWLDWYGEGCKE